MPLTINATSYAAAGAIPTVAGQNVEDFVRLTLGDTNSANYEFSATDLTMLLKRAVIEYRHYRPYIKEYSFTTIKDTYLYALPADCLEVVVVDWRPLPGLSATGLAAWFNTLLYPQVLLNSDWSDESLNRVRKEIAIRFDEIGKGEWRPMNNPTSYAPESYVILYPTPGETGLTVTTRYTSEHPLQNNDYFTINAGDAHHVQDLLIAQCLDVRVIRIGTSANVTRTGTTDIRWDAKTLAAQASALRQDVIDHLSTPVIVHG